MKRLKEDGAEWDIELPSGRPEYWACVEGRTYVSDRAILLRLNEVTQSSSPAHESPALQDGRNRQMIDQADDLPEHAWHPLPDMLTVKLSLDQTEFCVADLARRNVDLVYLNWIVATFGVPELATISDAEDSPIFFRFQRGY